MCREPVERRCATPAPPQPEAKTYPAKTIESRLAAAEKASQRNEKSYSDVLKRCHGLLGSSVTRLQLVLVRDLTDYLLQYVLQRNHADHGTMRVHHEARGGALSSEILQSFFR